MTKNETKTWVKVVGVVLLIALFATITLLYSNSKVDMANRAKDEVYNADINLKNAEIVKLGDEKLEVEADKVMLESTIADKDKTIEDRDIEIAVLKVTVTDFETAEEVIEASYTIDDVEINKPIVSIKLSDRQINLFDGKIEYDGDEFNAQETLELFDIFHATNGEYEESTYLELGSVEYKYEIKSRPVIEDDKLLEINLLGKDVEISAWGTKCVTFTSGEEYTFYEGESKEIDGQTVTVVTISDESKKVLVKIGEESHVIENEESFDTLDVYVKEVMTDEAGDGPDIATLKIGKDVEVDVCDSEEYDEDDNNNIWIWKITGTSIGLVTDDEFKGLDEDEFNALGVGDALCLPDYRCIEFNGLNEEPTETYDIDVYDSKNDLSYVRINGVFFNTVTLDEYDTLLIKPDAIYDKDEYNAGVYLKIDDPIELGNTEKILSVVGKDITLGDFSFNFNTLKVDPTFTCVLGTDDENYRTNYGSIIKNLETLSEDQDFSIVIPEEQLFGTITVY